MSRLFATKPLAVLLGEANSTGHGALKRTLGAGNLVALGVGAIIGSGLFIRTANAVSQASGPGVTLAFVLAALGCVFAGLCYAEFAAMIPIAGSAYTYAYTTMGEFVAWVIGWALIMEYALGAATVSIGWSEYLNKLLQAFDVHLPYSLTHSPLESAVLDGVAQHGLINLPAVLVVVALSLLLVKGTQESAVFNSVMVVVKVAVVLLFIGVGWQFIEPANHTPYLIPENAEPVKNAAGEVVREYSAWNKHGWGGILGGAAIVFFAFIGFDAVSTAAQEAKNPKRDMPISILGSLAICTVLYVLFGHVLTGVANWREFADPSLGAEASVAYAIRAHMPGYGWLATAVTLAILLGFSSVVLVMLMGQSRVFFSMAKDGLMPNAFAELHPRYRTPYKSNLVLMGFVGLFAAFVPGSLAGDLTSFGTLLAFVLVSIGVWLMRRSHPEQPRPFRAPLSSPRFPLVPFLGALLCTLLIAALDAFTLQVAAVWMLLGFVVYFLYGKKHSKLQQGIVVVPTELEEPVNS
ncbi:amino acid permease [Hymenobacter chitinivorans]|uniref:APA family basic amino acid/polyamine antiporter n=1 Tax=Hymenobacter chitinivorans DSM 11115 TaxID=1121954 RepID=A0A2M9BNF0_9BACT|nr:amino acid permease [Hymenobacter chitinivorans]PJJ59481.1 APA family basic amino acid/polyamine antiporter [Hymenobacter chitinivorans DSM 11115]